MNDFGWRLSSDFPATFQRLSSDFRLSDYDQRLSRWSVSDYGWRLSDYDRPPSFLKEVRRFSDLLTGGRVPVVIAAGVLVSWCPGVHGSAAGNVRKFKRKCTYKSISEKSEFLTENTLTSSEISDIFRLSSDITE